MDSNLGQNLVVAVLALLFVGGMLVPPLLHRLRNKGNRDEPSDGE